ncbi:MAG: biopolymer transporter ExbD [Lentisphaerae bacterium]|nr:biopolymer transporter ExbD [Lentisphaerota bacterium]
MKSCKLSRESQDSKLQVAAMVDVVFLLLVFFVLTIKPVDLPVGLSVSRPGMSDQVCETPIELLRINVHGTGFFLNGAKVNLDRIDRILSHVAEFTTRASVIITCSSDSKHSDLIKVLDLCSKTGMTNIALMTAR